MSFVFLQFRVNDHMYVRFASEVSNKHHRRFVVLGSECRQVLLSVFRSPPRVRSPILSVLSFCFSKVSVRFMLDVPRVQNVIFCDFENLKQ